MLTAKNDLLNISQWLHKSARRIAEYLEQEREHILPPEKLPSTPEEKEMGLGYTTEFIQLIAKLMIEEDPSQSTKKMRDYGEHLGEIAVKMGADLDEALEGTPNFRKGIWHQIGMEAKEREFSIDHLLLITSLIDPLLDQAIHGFSIAYVKSNRNLMQKFNDSLQELSVPVVPLSKGIAVLPLIGEIDTHRASLIMEIALSKSKELNLSGMILDLSGVNYIDTMVAHHLFKVIETLQLLGVKAILTGIRPEIALTATTLNLDFSKTLIKATLHHALRDLDLIK